MRVETAVPNDICITGLGVAACLGLDVETVWRRVKRGECGIGPMPALESPLPPGGDGGQVPDLPSDFLPGLSREARYLRWTIDSALSDAKCDATVVHKARVSLLLGTTLHGMRAAGTFLRTGDYAHLASFLAGDVARVATQGLVIGGLRATTCSACSSSLGAVALAVTLLESGETDLVIAGGYDAVSEYAYAGFGALRLISDRPLRPFAQDRAGMKVAEGYGIVVLERRHDAERRGATIRAVVAGWGESADAFHLTRPHPQGTGALSAMRQAVDRAGIRPADLDMIAAHATGTIENDNSEAAAIMALLADATCQIPVVGLKSHLGHTLGGAGAVELALSAMAMRDGVVPPTAGGGELAYDALCVARSPVTRAIRHTLNTSLGFGGANTCVVLRSPHLTVVLDQAEEYPGKGLQGSGGADGTHRPLKRSDHESEPGVVITGVGVLVPGAIGNQAFVEFMQDRRPTDRFTIDDAEYEALVPNARRLRRMSTYVKLSICAATMAAREADLLSAPDLLRDTGAILGTMHGSAGYCYEYYEQIVRDGMTAANPMLFAEGVPNAAAAQMSLTLGLTGSCQTILGTRTSGLDALRLASLRIAAGDADRIIVCAAEEAHPVLDAAYATCGGAPSVSLAVAFVLEARSVAERRGVISRGSPSTVMIASRSALRFKNGDAFSVEPMLSLAWHLLDPASRVSGTSVSSAEADHDATIGLTSESIAR